MNIPRILCISGKARHGKDTTARYLKHALERDGKRVLVTHYGDLLKFMTKEYLNWNGKKDEEGRKLLQHVGTELVREKYPDFWVKYMAEVITLFREEFDYVIIADTRFVNELTYYSREHYVYPVKHIRVYRPNFDNGLTPEQKNHVSETQLDNAHWDYFVQNWSDLNALRKQVNRLAQEILRREIIE